MVDPAEGFIQLYEGDGVEILPESEFFNFQCCGCGMIHRIEIEHTKENTQILSFYDYEEDENKKTS